MSKMQQPFQTQDTIHEQETTSSKINQNNTTVPLICTSSLQSEHTAEDHLMVTKNHPCKSAVVHAALLQC